MHVQNSHNFGLEIDCDWAKGYVMPVMGLPLKIASVQGFPNWVPQHPGVPRGAPWCFVGCSDKWRLEDQHGGLSSRMQFAQGSSIILSLRPPSIGSHTVSEHKSNERCHYHQGLLGAVRSTWRHWGTPTSGITGTWMLSSPPSNVYVHLPGGATHKDFMPLSFSVSIFIFLQDLGEEREKEIPNMGSSWCGLSESTYLGRRGRI